MWEMHVGLEAKASPKATPEHFLKLGWPNGFHDRKRGRRWLGQKVWSTKGKTLSRLRSTGKSCCIRKIIFEKKSKKVPWVKFVLQLLCTPRSDIWERRFNVSGSRFQGRPELGIHQVRWPWEALREMCFLGCWSDWDYLNFNILLILFRLASTELVSIH